MAGSVRPVRQGVRAAALRSVAEHPGISQRELAELVSSDTGIAKSSAVAAVRTLERHGDLVSSRNGGRKAYVLGDGSEPPPPDLPDEDARDEAGEEHPEPAGEPATALEPETETLVPAAQAAAGVPTWRLALVLAALAIVNVLAVWLLLNA